jgi:hypothetical protein
VVQGVLELLQSPQVPLEQLLHDILRAFPEIFQRKQRLEVGIVKTGPLLGRVKQIKTGAGPDVVNVPNGAVVFPSHPRSKTGFEVRAKFRDCTTEKFESARRLIFSLHPFLKPLAKTDSNPINGVRRIPVSAVTDGVFYALRGVRFSPKAALFQESPGVLTIRGPHTR